MENFFTNLGIFLSLWRLWLPVFLIILFFKLWVKYLKSLAASKIDWLLLEIKIPRTIESTPKAMEMVFSGLHGIATSVKFLDKWWFGKIQEWFSLEIIGVDGMVSFLIRTPGKFKGLVEAQIHAYYPDAEITPVADYADSLAKKIPSSAYDIAGVELVLEKDDYYPIRTFLAFDERQAERRIDTMASFLEILSKLKPEENIYLQYLIYPAGKADAGAWKEKGRAQIDKLLGKKTAVKKGLFGKFIGGAGEFLINLIQAPVVYPEWGEAKKDEVKAASQNLSPGDKVIVEGIENKISKLGFKTCIRFAYVAKKDAFNKSNVAAINGAFKQFNTINLNGFKGNGKAGTSVDQPRIIPAIKNRREFLRKLSFIDRYANRKLSKNDHNFILNTEELATIYHYPILIVGTPTLQHVEAKKAEPPMSLPTE